MTSADVVIPGAPDDVLLRAVPVLRGMRTRITRYDVGEGTLEARGVCCRVPSILRLRVTPEGEGATRLRIESEAGGRWRLVARAVSAWNLRLVRWRLLPGG